MLRASEYGMYEVDRSQAIERRIEDDRGIRFAFEPLFNCPVVDVPGDEGAVLSLEQVRRALPETTMQHQPMRRTLTLLRFDLFQYHGAVHLSLWTGDTSRVPATAAEALLRAL